jgi:hypothetical protein
MPYLNRRRHNLSSIPQTPCQTLITPCPNFDPIYQVILLENSNQWNLSPSKSRIPEKKERGARIEKQKRWNLIWKAPGLKKKRIKFTSCWERFYQKKEWKEITFSYSTKSDVWPHPYPHIICICTIFYSSTFPFLTPIHYTILHQPWLFVTQTL